MRGGAYRFVMKPCCAQRDRRIKELLRIVAKQQAQIQDLQKEVAELKARLGRNSKNSHKPPSTDSPRFKQGKPLPPPGEPRAPGGQPGHPGKTRKMASPREVTHTHVLRPSVCSGCLGRLDQLPFQGEPLRHQVVELPEIRPEIHEYRLHSVQCRCGHVTRARLPAEATTHTGPRLTAYIGWLSGSFGLSRSDVVRVLASMGISMSPGTVQNACERVSHAVAAPVHDLEKLLSKSRSVHLDETGWKMNGEICWLWAALTQDFACFAIHDHRGFEQLKAWFPGPYRGFVHSDRWVAYQHFDVEHRQLCWAHLTRDLQAIVDRGASGATKASAVKGRLDTEIFGPWRRFLSQEIDRKRLLKLTARFCKDFHGFCEEGAQQDEDGGWRRLGASLLSLWPAVFAFFKHDHVFPTNNEAERGLRSGVMWRRMSQGTRSEAGSAFVARMLTVSATCEKQKRDARKYLYEALMANWKGEEVPSLLGQDRPP